MLSAAESVSGRETGSFNVTSPAPFGISALGADDVGGVPKGDFYKITADGNKTIEIETSTPAGLAGEFQNGLDSIIRLYDAAGKFLATNDNGAPDRRNAKLSYKVPKNAWWNFLRRGGGL